MMDASIASPFPRQRLAAGITLTENKPPIAPHKRFGCSAAKQMMHVSDVESLRFFRGNPNYLCSSKDREPFFLHGLAIPAFGHLGIVSPPHLAIDPVSRQSGSVRWGPL